MTSNQKDIIVKPKLLVVDDEPVNIQVLYQVFAATHQVFMATSGEQALALAASKLPDLILLDVTMQGMDGFSMCARLKAEPATRDIPVIFVTAHSDPDSETKGLEMGAVDFITKPINPAVVRARVSAHLTLKLQSDRLREMVFLDGLTGVFNRRYFDERLETESKRALRAGSPLSLIMVDVDHFKQYNDRYGHQLGDDCLQRVATCLRDHLRRPGDILARYGGEEFACVLSDTDLRGALTVASDLEQAVRELNIEHADSSAANVVTISLGVAEQPAGTSIPVSQLIALADAQLYLAKQSGRGRVCGLELDGNTAA